MIYIGERARHCPGAVVSNESIRNHLSRSKRVRTFRYVRLIEAGQAGYELIYVNALFTYSDAIGHRREGSADEKLLVSADTSARLSF